MGKGMSLCALGGFFVAVGMELYHAGSKMLEAADRSNKAWEDAARNPVDIEGKNADRA